MSDELLDLPEGWEWKNLGELVLNIQYGYTASATDEPTKIKFLRITDLQENSVDWETVPFCNCSEIDKYKLVPGDIVIARTGATTGKSFLLKQIPETTIFASYLIRLHTSNLCPPEYLALFMQSPKYWRQITTVSKGTAQPGANASILSNLIIPLPPLNEQKRIVAKIEELRDRTQKAQKALETIPQLCDRFRQSVLAAAFRGDLTADWREKNPDVEPASVLLERIRNKRLVEAKTDKHKENIEAIYSYEEEYGLECLPDNWQYVTLEKIYHTFQYGTSAKSSPEGKIPVLRMGNLQNGEIDWDNLVYTSDDDEISKYNLKPGDVLFNRTNSPELVGKTSIYRGELPAIFAGYLIRIENNVYLNSEYLNYCLNTTYAKNYCWKVKTDGVSQSNINAQKLAKFEIPFCSLQEQEEIVKQIFSLLRAIDNIEKQHQQTTEKLEKLNQSILSKAFRGELVPQDPEDEPASVLLERIRAEREKSNNSKPKTTSKRKSKTPKGQGTIPGLE